MFTCKCKIRALALKEQVQEPTTVIPCNLHMFEFEFMIMFVMLYNE